jgi:hypothetical protein
MARPGLLFLLVVPCLMSCQNDSTTGVSPQVQMALGPGLTNVLPHQREGTQFPLTVLVTVGGQPAANVEVRWDDYRYPSYLSDRTSLSDSDGLAHVTWSLPYLPGDTPWFTFNAQAAVPGAAGNPVEYTIEVYRCTKNC